MSCCPSRRAPLGLCLAVATLLLFAGCKDPTATAPTQKAAALPAQPLTVLVVDDEELEQAIAREWKARTEEDLKIRHITPVEIAISSRLPGDVIVFPSSLIGYLAERG